MPQSTAYSGIYPSTSPPRGGHGGAAPVLDPYKNISNGQGAAIANFDAQLGTDYQPGHYRRKYESAAQNGAWGREWGTCGRMTLVRQEGAATTIIPALCGCWSCELCGIRRAAWLKAQIRAAVPTYGLEWFWTLTLSTNTCTAPESFTVITSAWNRCHTLLSKHYGRYSYVWTVEATSQGYAHLHLLSSLRISSHAMHGRWHQATGGSFGAKVEPARSSRAADYLAKYCAKQATLRRLPGWDALRNRRAFSKSRNIEFEPFRSPGGGDWSVMPRAYWDVAEQLRGSGVVLAERVTGVPVLKVAHLEVVS